MSKYFISIICLLLALRSFGQTQTDYESRDIYLRPGIDISRLALDYLNDIEYTGLEFSLDTEVKYKFFPTIEAGITNVRDFSERHQYQSDGQYIRFGLDYNMLNYQHRLDRNMFYVGCRYAFSRFDHSANNIAVQNDWGLGYTSFEANNLHAQWFEGVMGLRGEIFKNFFMGYSVRFKFLTHKSKFGDYKPYIIPGFGKGNRYSVVGMTYSLYYAIPIKKAAK